MQLVLYRNLSSDNTINKVLANGTAFNINLKRETDILNPDLFLVRLTGIDYNEFNYAEIVELKRFYFINSVSSVNASLFKLECSTDVIETYKQDILNSYASFNKKLEAGDYGETNLSLTGEVSIADHVSSITLEPADNSLLSILRWN